MTTMTAQCNDIETLLPTYLDGELSTHDQLSFDHHIADCGDCRDRVRGEAAYLARVREILAPPAPSDDLVVRVRLALDQEDIQSRSARRRSLRAWALPGASGLAAAAALVLLVTSDGGSGRAPLQSDWSPETGADPLAARPIGVDRAQPISLAPQRVSWRPVQVRFEAVAADGTVHQVGLEVLSCRNVDMSGHARWTAADAVLWVARGQVNTVIYQTGGTCMVFASDMALEQLAPQIVRSGLIGQ
ncbi:MAG TPA: zf-HC2 domain-containing protein [Kofleriaceae bacterium]|nr:zf-HC2 domain-containing protein [Kofleriaceae bacterium]